MTELSMETKIKLNNGVFIPQLGVGTYQINDKKQLLQILQWAFEYGYRHVDTAKAYGNEAWIKDAINQSELSREEIFITSKLSVKDQREGTTKTAVDESLELLGVDYIDLYLIHWPVTGKWLEAWKVIEEMYQRGKMRAIGVCNCKVHHLEQLMNIAQVKPAVDQMEFNPLMQDYDTYHFCKDNEIAFEAWSPLGNGTLIKHPSICAIGKKYGKSAPQVIIRWLLEKNIIIFPKSLEEFMLKENSEVFDFSLTAEEHEWIDSLNENKRTGPDPDDF
jgi:diketogulonate reductase-like aldo/keto reductase